jgi:hypothetical protein
MLKKIPSVTVVGGNSSNEEAAFFLPCVPQVPRAYKTVTILAITDATNRPDTTPSAIVVTLESARNNINVVQQYEDSIEVDTNGRC